MLRTKKARPGARKARWDVTPRVRNTIARVKKTNVDRVPLKLSPEFAALRDRIGRLEERVAARTSYGQRGRLAKFLLRRRNSALANTLVRV
jgi:hypothetical protein